MLRRAVMLWLLAYLAVMSALVGGLVVMRGQLLARLETPEARREWQLWKRKAAEQAEGPGPVRRRPVKSDEPPAVILLRDRFMAIVVTTVSICSFLFAFLAFVASGVFRGRAS